MTEQIIVMGVSGCGKSTVGIALAERLGCPYYDGDDFHPEKNIAKMRQNIPLTDEDREGWLEMLNKILLSASDGAVLACSALKPEYRTRLSKAVKEPIFVYLKGDFDTIWSRHKKRKNHFFSGKKMLENQFETLIEPIGDNVITVDVRLTVAEIVEEIWRTLRKKN